MAFLDSRISGSEADPHERRARVAFAYREACALELAALKPGNVHRESAGHGMSVDDFLRSAEVSASPLTELGLGLGERLLRAVAATREAVGCNTNLGILLLSAPLAQAALDPLATGDLRARLQRVLADASVADTAGLFEAIRLAAPGGLGTAQRHDVAGRAEGTPLEVMADAAGRDEIARQYVTGLGDLFGGAQRLLADLEARWSDSAWAAAGLYLEFLSRVPDSHVSRKHGADVARCVMERAQPVCRDLLRAKRPQSCRAELRRLDRELKAEGINPGTSADLTVASLLIRRLQPLCSEHERTADERRYSPSPVGRGASRAYF